ncbi:MAG: phosphatidate cytidylyltransferase [Candidatus Acetothermia bacterium]
MNTTAKRILTAVIMVPGVFALLFFAKRNHFPWAVGIFLALSSGIAVFEFSQLMAKAGLQLRPLSLALIASLSFFALIWFDPQQTLLIGGSTLLAGTLINIRNLSLSKNLKNAAAAILALIYIPWLLHYFYVIYAAQDGIVHAINVLLIVWGYDTGAYFAGRWLGKHQIAPHISPNKTIEGLGGGLVVAFLGASLSPVWVPYMAWIPHILLIAFLVGLSTQLGDLVESSFKRLAGVKDSGELLPGHGGVLDRIDGLLLALPTFYFYFHYILRFI